MFEEEFPEGEVPHIEVDEETRETIREMLSQMEKPVELNFFVGGYCRRRSTNWCVPTEELLELIRELAPTNKIILNKYVYEKDADVFLRFDVEPERVPVIYFGDGYIRYLGSPLGEEVGTFVETIIRVSTGRSGLREKTREALKMIREGQGSRRVYIVTIVTPACPLCPKAVLKANMFALESRGLITSIVVEAYEQPDIADLYGITAVPAVILAREGEPMGSLEYIGIPPEFDLLRKVVELARG